MASYSVTLCNFALMRSCLTIVRKLPETTPAKLSLSGGMGRGKCAELDLALTKPLLLKVLAPKALQDCREEAPGEKYLFQSGGHDNAPLFFPGTHLAPLLTPRPCTGVAGRRRPGLHHPLLAPSPLSPPTLPHRLVNLARLISEVELTTP